MSNDEKIQDTPATGLPAERIAKVLARAGIGSRRDVERMIAEGRIWLDGKKLETPAVLVSTLQGITVDGEPVGDVRETKIWRMHKRRGTLTTHKDPMGRQTVFDNLPNHVGRVIAIGRLDMNTEGLLLLTNDGELARWMELPSTALVRRYRVRAYGRVDEKALAKLADGVTIDGIHYGAVEAKLERQAGANAWITVAIREGKNREVRKVLEHLGLEVNRLIRTHYGPFALGNLPLEGVATVPDKQLRDALSAFFNEATGSVAAPIKKHDPSKWAKAKKDDRPKPGAKRRRQSRIADADAPKPGMRKPRGERDGKPEGNIKGKPAGKPTARSAGRPEGKPEGKFGGKPTGRSTGKPGGAARPSGKGPRAKGHPTRGPKK
ncbi:MULTISPECIES: pseudouridine synthase [Kordiimonas]|jgi:23S rRNA pseudouridine2605 synthase|uniref:pseudouridine synthase n=1 Tax=Kordiimonas TaxID=288021 RepID=UPI00257FC4FA|nr:pseudouridine synthase [Kordiimonas sp. UBA4487]